MPYTIKLSLAGRVLTPLWEKRGFLYTDQTGKLMFKSLLCGGDVFTPAYYYLRSLGYKFSVRSRFNIRKGDFDVQIFVTTPDGRRILMKKTNPEYRDWITEISGFLPNQFVHQALAEGLAAHARFKGYDEALVEHSDRAEVSA